MSESKQREKSAGLTRWIEASEQERVAMSMILTNLARAKGPNQSRHRRCYEQFQLLAAAEAMADAEAAAEELAEEKSKSLNRHVDPKGVRISQFSAELVEYEITQDVIEYFTKLHEEADVPGGWNIYSGSVKERMEDKSYKAPRDRVAAVAEEPKV
jgi:uncharacterized protein YdiU (UPF0061 family)